MKSFNLKSNIDFMGKRKLALIFSVLIFVIALSSLFIRGLNLGIDFTGGTLVELGYPQKTDINSDKLLYYILIDDKNI